MKIVNLHRDQARQCFSDLRIVKFRIRQEPEPPHVQKKGWAYIANHSYNYQSELTRFARELKEFMKETGISYGWSNSLSQMYSASITCLIINPEDYSLLTLMSDEYDITTSHMLPANGLENFMVYLTDTDYEKYKDAISQVKR